MKRLVKLTLDTGLGVGDAGISLVVQQVVEFRAREDFTESCTNIILEVSL